MLHDAKLQKKSRATTLCDDYVLSTLPIITIFLSIKRNSSVSITFMYRDLFYLDVD